MGYPRAVRDCGEYLRGIGAEISNEELQTFGPYLNDQYTLVITRIDSRETLLEEFPEEENEMSARRPCVYVEFPTARPFFPLKPTSAYGDEIIPVRLYVTGYVWLGALPKYARVDVRYFQHRIAGS
ncbi:MAG: hypothetical protein Kow0099_11510 [Candidatus Abyssubacteria bacterium]